jgi:hypothetical protein
MCIIICIIYTLESRQRNQGDLSVLIYFTQIAVLIAGPMRDWVAWLGVLAETSTSFFGYCAIFVDDVQQSLLGPLYILLAFFGLGLMLAGIQLLLSRVTTKVVVDTNLQIRTALAILLFNVTSLMQAALSSLTCVNVGKGRSRLYVFFVFFTCTPPPPPPFFPPLSKIFWVLIHVAHCYFFFKRLSTFLQFPSSEH